MNYMVSVAALAVALIGVVGGVAEAQYPQAPSYGYVPNYAPAQVSGMAGPGSYNWWNSSGSYTSGYQTPSSSYIQGQSFSVGGYTGSMGYGGYYNASQFTQGTTLVPAGVYNYGTYRNEGAQHSLRYYYGR